MEKKLENIFVPYEIAKLAYEKGFREWCAGLVNTDNDFRGNVFYDPEEADMFDFESGTGMFYNGYVSCPTHFQLISWLKINHNIDVTMNTDGKWWVISKSGDILGSKEFEINEALEIALNILPDKNES